MEFKYLAFFFGVIRDHISKGENRGQIKEVLEKIYSLTSSGTNDCLDKFCEVTGHSFKE